MADEQIGIDLLLNSGAAATSVRELKQSIRDLQGEALKAGAAGDDALAAKFTSAAGKARDRMADLNKEINAAQDTGSKLGAVTGVARSLAGGFAGAAGAAALFGGAQKDVQEQLLKVQGAVALLAGIQEVADIKKNFNIAKTIVLQEVALAQTKLGIATESGGIVVRNLAAAAQWALNAAMSANPIMLIVVGIGALVAALSTFDSAAERSQKAQKKLNDEMKMQEGIIDKIIEKQKEYLAIRVNSVKDQEQEVALLKANGASKKEIYEAESELIRRKISDAELLRKSGQEQGIAEITAYQDLLTQKLVLDATYKKANADENEKDRLKRQKEFEDEWQTYSDSYDAKEVERLKRIEESNAQNSQARMDADAANQLLTSQTYEAELTAQSEQDRKELTASVDLYLQKKALKEKEVADEQKARDAKIKIAQDGFTILTSLGKIAGLQGQAAVNFNKALAIVQIGIDTAKGISAAIAAGAGVPFPGNIPAIISGVAAVLSGIAAANSALSAAGATPPTTPSPSFGAGTGGTAPLSPTTTNVNNTNTTLVEQQSQSPVIVKAYVVESEMTNHQQHIKNIEQKATFP